VYLSCMKTAIHVRVHPDTLSRLRGAERHTKLTRSAIVTVALNDYMDALDAQRRSAGLPPIELVSSDGTSSEPESDDSDSGEVPA
jgi:hypothetical protein